MDQTRNNTTEDEHPQNANGNTESARINQVVSEENSQDRSPERETNEGGIDRSGGKLEEESSQLEESGSAGSSAGDIEPLGPALDQEFANGLLSKPNNAEIFIKGNNCAIGEGRNTNGQHGLPIAEQDEIGAPVHSYSDSSVQIPCVGGNFTFFALVQDHPAIQEQWFSIHFVSTHRFREGRVQRQIRTMEEQHGIKVIPMGDEYLSQCESQHFHTTFVEAHLTIKFQLVNQVERKFILRDAQVADKSPLHRVLSLGEYRFPGAIARACVKCMAQPGEPPCEDHLRVTMEYGNRTTRHMLISFWSSG